MLQVTPLLVGSFATVAVKSWLPLVRRLTVSWTMETEIGRGAGVSGSEPQAATRTKPAPTSDILWLNRATGDPRLIALPTSLHEALMSRSAALAVLSLLCRVASRPFVDW